MARRMEVFSSAERVERKSKKVAMDAEILSGQVRGGSGGAVRLSATRKDSRLFVAFPSTAVKTFAAGSPNRDCVVEWTVSRRLDDATIAEAVVFCLGTGQES